MTDQPTQDAIVSQRAREAAAAFVLVGSGFASAEKDALATAIELGQADDHWVTQAFASFEVATIERCAGVCDAWLDPTKRIIAEVNGLSDHDIEIAQNVARGCSAAIRNLKGQTS